MRRPRPSDPWFDQECRDAKRLERAYSAACRRLTCSGSAAAAAAVAAADTAKAAWYAQQTIS